MEEVNILVFGDSIVYGAYDEEKAGWVNRLRLTLENKNDCYYNIFNLGIPGETSTNIKERFTYECKYRTNEKAKTIIVFSIGINDSYIIEEKNNVSISKFRNNILDLINMSKEYTQNILFVGLSRVDESKVNPLPWNNSISYFNREIIKFDKELENICQINQIEYLSIFDLFEMTNLNDGLHPDSIGHQKICDEVLKKLEKMHNDCAK